ncbi:MAG TPA: hypothetical protein PL124_11645 [Candidatus Cloacimonadota bacterium]|nr:hypothetical protein [Candidatus Cloacimonadota bacterium]
MNIIKTKSMAAKFSDLVDYFERIAEEHVSIKHSATQKHFFRFELDEVLAGLTSKLNYPALILEAYDFDFADSRSDNIIKQRNGAFILIDKVSDTGDFAKIHEVWDEMEEIGDDILIRMRRDKALRIEPVLRDFDIAMSSGVPFDVRAYGQYGMRFTFSLRCPVNNEVDTAKWLT